MHNTTWSVCSMLLVCVCFQGCPVDIILSLGKTFSCSQLSCSSLSGLRLRGLVSMSVGIIVHLMFKQSCWWSFMVVASDFPRRHISQQAHHSCVSYLQSLLCWAFSFRSCLVIHRSVLSSPLIKETSFCNRQEPLQKTTMDYNAEL